MDSVDWQLITDTCLDNRTSGLH